MAASYNSVNNSNTPPSNHPYGAGDPYYTESTGFITPQAAQKKRMSNWVKFGVPVLILVIVAAVLGGVLGSRASNNSSSGSGGSAAAEAAASSAASAAREQGRFAVATDSKFMEPIYPATTNTAAFTSPTFLPSTNAGNTWPKDPFQPANPSPTNVREDRPRIIAPSHMWAALPTLIANDPYLKGWNDTIFANATDYYGKPPVAYFMDGDSGILDNCREIKMRIKAFAYAYRMTNDTRWVDRAWTEIQNAAGNGTTQFGPDQDRWNANHFLDAAECSAAYGIGYDWLHDILTDEQKSMMRSTLITYGLQPGLAVFTGQTTYGWWSNNITGNWNCVCNGGLTVASLAILGDDTTGVANQLLGFTIDNAKANCAFGVTDDGSWTETPNYWYFGTTGHAEMAAALISATGSDYDLLTVNPNFSKTGLYHMAVSGPGSLFDYGDHGPNKFSTTANGMFVYAKAYNKPEYALYQRDQHDAAEPWSMFWYDPSVHGAFWDGAPLDVFFDNANDQWASMRSSWTDRNAMFVGIKAGRNDNHQTHNDLDVGDFVLDCLGTRWAGEFGSADYRSPNYFSSGAQDADRWKYYRKMTEGQNTILIGRTNQRVDASPSVKHETSGTKQGSSTVFDVPDDSTVYWVADMTSAYSNAASVKRGARLLNKRRQFLLRDEINAQASVDWQMHTNATVQTNGASATLNLDGQQMTITMLNPPQGASFSTRAAQRFDSDTQPPVPDQENPGVTTLMVSLPAGQYTLEMLFNPQWQGMSQNDFVNPPSVPLDNWSLTSH